MYSIKNYGLAAALLIALGISACTPPTPPSEQSQAYAYVSNQDGGVTIIDLATMETTGSVDI
ncbi:MAG: hypothetical protein LBE24_09435, partial [Methylobacillus sp.]|nr:hypothetical protein [Methylobacillus sp.]